MRVRRLLPLAIALAIGACVEIAVGPSGIASIRLLGVPPSIILGDTLRDSTGAVVRLRAVAFGERGDTIGDAPFRFTALALPRDTTEAQRAIPLVVDSLTGFVVAKPTAANSRARASRCASATGCRCSTRSRS
ncbi:hypothetical protein J421_2709 [Gemmatirosa kalamazoonensis]|uniref:Lipoprotein n=1 Tax=Gemmatirosa kalamazoonensis TaxID=861299 RepID=W0RHK8_9BACT|nr:hypothetical protein [Gemmatirosa kalamazoonensis]AHG90246.1 hypothetical protein J421_2709 [Gemmatirosa kalamazoonensis]